jgi:transglutaminase-like putative cysteine protease
MYFHIVHTTEYEYSDAAVESYTELRVQPRSNLRQVVHRHMTQVTPRVPMESFVDYYGNHVEFLSVPFRHRHLTVTSRSAVETREILDPLSGFDLTISEAVRFAWPHRRELFDFLMPSRHCPMHESVESLAAELLPSRAPFVASLLGFNKYLHKNFKYHPGVTDVSTPIAQVIDERRGVCQDFAHVMIAVLRCAGLAARYVSGYIETDAAARHSEEYPVDPVEGTGLEEEPADVRLIGSTASHAWVEVFAPSGTWVGLDPTNNMLESERHVQIGIGRDYADVPPLRGVFKGARQQLLNVRVSVRRTKSK